MRALLVPLEGEPFFRHIDQGFRGSSYSLIEEERGVPLCTCDSGVSRDDPHKSHCQSWHPSQKVRTFMWRNQYARGRTVSPRELFERGQVLDILFDLFEEVRT